MWTGLTLVTPHQQPSHKSAPRRRRRAAPFRTRVAQRSCRFARSASAWWSGAARSRPRMMGLPRRSPRHPRAHRRPGRGRAGFRRLRRDGLPCACQLRPNREHIMGTQRVHNVLQKGGADGWAPCGEGRTIRSAGSCGGECGRLRLRTRGGGRARPLHRAGAATDGRPPANARSPSSGWLAWSETPRQYCSPREDGYQDEPCAAAPPPVARTRRPGAVDSRARRLAQENGKSIGGRPPWSGGGWHGSLRAIQGKQGVRWPSR